MRDASTGSEACDTPRTSHNGGILIFLVVLATLSLALIAGSEGRLSKAKQTLRELHETDAFDPKQTSASMHHASGVYGYTNYLAYLGWQAALDEIGLHVGRPQFRHQAD